MIRAAMVSEHCPSQAVVFGHDVVCGDLIDRVATTFRLRRVLLVVIADAVPAVNMVIARELTFGVSVCKVVRRAQGKEEAND